MEHPAGWHKVGLDVNHIDLCRFPNASDENYRIVRKHVNALLIEATQRQEHNEERFNPSLSGTLNLPRILTIQFIDQIV